MANSPVANMTCSFHEEKVLKEPQRFKSRLYLEYDILLVSSPQLPFALVEFRPPFYSTWNSELLKCLGLGTFSLPVRKEA